MGAWHGFGALELDGIGNLAGLADQEHTPSCSAVGIVSSASKATTMPRTAASSWTGCSAEQHAVVKDDVVDRQDDREGAHSCPDPSDLAAGEQLEEFPSGPSWRSGCGLTTATRGDGAPGMPPNGRGPRECGWKQQLCGKTEQLIDSSDGRFARYATSAPALCALEVQPREKRCPPTRPSKPIGTAIRR